MRRPQRQLERSSLSVRTVLARNEIIQTRGILDLKLGLFLDFCQQGQFSAPVYQFTKKNP